jgi:glycosyltransferase involved in cell wall biosynthesis
MTSPSPRLSLIVLVPSDGRAALPAVLADAAALTDVELIIVDHSDDASSLDIPGATVVRSDALGRAQAFMAGFAVATSQAVVFRDADARSIPAGLAAALDFLDANSEFDAAITPYVLRNNTGATVHEVTPSQDGDNPPPGWENATVFRRAAAAELALSVGFPVFTALYRKLRLDGKVGNVEAASASITFEAFALARFDHRRDLHLLDVHSQSYDDANPWLTAVLVGDNVADTRACLARMAGQVMPPGTFELLIVDTSDSGRLAALVAEAQFPVGARSIVAPGLGRGAALQAGADAALGVVVLFADAKATPFPDLVEQHVRAHRSMTPREVVVLGTWETSATDLSRALPRVLDEGDYVPGRTGLGGGQFHGGDVLHAGNMSIPRDVLTRCGGFDAAMPDPVVDRDLGRRLADLGYRPYYFEAARLLRPTAPDLAGLRAWRINLAKAMPAFFNKHPDALEGDALETKTVAGLQALIDKNTASVKPVGSAATALCDIEVANLEPVGDEWRGFAADIAERLQKLVRHMDVLWRASGLKEGLVNAGLDGMPQLLAQHPRIVPGARAETVLLFPHGEADDAWLLTLGRFLSGFSRDEDTTLVVLADEANGVTPAAVREASVLLSERLRPAPAGAWPHVLVVDRATLGGGLLRIFAGASGWVPSGSPEDADLQAVADQAGVGAIDAVAWESRVFGIRPTNLRTNRPIRVLAWPNWSDKAELEALMTVAGDSLADRPDTTLCLRYDESDGDPDAALTRLADAYEEIVGAHRTLDVLLVEQPLEAGDLPALGRAVDATIGLASSDEGERSSFYAGLDVPRMDDAAQLAEHVQTIAARNPGPLMPSQVYVA